MDPTISSLRQYAGGRRERWGGDGSGAPSHDSRDP
jgi:hypothetical protein